MIKAILFDLDGVLVETDKWHYYALNIALEAANEAPISWKEHLEIYKGRPTKIKLSMMTERRGLSPEKYERIAAIKQDYTVDMITKFSERDEEKIAMMRLLQRDGYHIAVCSNAIQVSAGLMLERSGYLEFLDFYLGNEDAPPGLGKPAPNIYQEAFRRLGITPAEAVIVEDSDVGRQAAYASGAAVCEVKDQTEVNYYRVKATVQAAERPQVVIPAAGQGKRFYEAGYQHPKPLIDVEGRPMISWVLDDFASLQARTIVLMQERHIERYCAHAIINEYHPGTQFVGVDGLTEGAACTLLLAVPELNPNGELILANSDQKVDVDLVQFVQDMRDQRADGGIMTFRDTNPKWSFARTDENDQVVEVAEKQPISNQATVGIYYYRRAGDFIKYAEQMIAKDIRTNGEFYACPVFNELIAAGGNVRVWEIEQTKMHGLGTPEDLQTFLAIHNTLLTA
jgi:beta-phosphoglucomutase-like phosphatase (HAD superfamily)/dTDP-glucose pyrophosphorylase